jgi:serine/threonine protein kinase
MSACPREYDVIRSIREGNRGGCNAGILVVRHRASGRRCVEKRFVSEHVRAGLVNHEIAVLRRMDHKNIVKIVDYYISPRNTTASMFLEYCNAGSIGTLIVAHARSRTHIREAMVRNVFRQMSKALEYCHCGPENIRRDWTPITHKDIKPGSYVCFEDYTILI